MKKILILICICLLCACGSKNMKWKDVETAYQEIEQNSQSYMADAQTITRNDYQLLLTNINDNLENFEAGVNKENREVADTLYESACKLLKLSSYSNSIDASAMQKLAQGVKDLVIAAYNKTDNFTELKTQIIDQISQVENWDDRNWAMLERYPSISWEEAETIYQQLDEELSEELTPRSKVDETELEDIKYAILNNYEKILNGVNDNNKQAAYDLYSAAYKLKAYTEGIDEDSAVKVNSFAIHAMEFVEKSYGKTIDDSGYDFLNEIESAKKWPLSLWSELTALMKKYS